MLVQAHPLGCNTCPIQRIGQRTATQVRLLPYRVNALLEKSSLRTVGDKFLHLLEFVYTTSFETRRIVKDEFVVAAEDEFILDVVYSALKRVNYDLRVISATWNTHPRGSLDLGQIDLIARLRINTTAYVDLDTHLLPMIVVDLWVFRSVTNRAEDGRLASVCPPDDKDPETAEFLSEVLEITCFCCRHCGEGLYKEK